MTLMRHPDADPIDRPDDPPHDGRGLRARRRRQRRALWLSALVYAVAVAALTVLPGWWMTH